MSKHTKGPWKIEVNNAADFQVVTEKYDVCIVGNENDDYNKANAHLIAAAPEMLEALEKIAISTECPDWLGDWVLPVIMKAKGESNE